MLYLICFTITSVDLAHYGVSRAKDWVSVDCGTILLDDKHDISDVSMCYLFLELTHVSSSAKCRLACGPWPFIHTGSFDGEPENKYVFHEATSFFFKNMFPQSFAIYMILYMHIDPHFIIKCVG